MDNAVYGTRDKRGDWKPNEPAETAPFWQGKLDLNTLGHWLLEYLWPWNASHMATALLYWAFIIPDVATMQTLSWGWALWLYLVNGLGIFVMYGAVEFFYYVKRRQEVRFKFNHKFPSEHP